MQQLNHGSFKSQEKAQKRADSFKKGDSTRKYFVHKRSIKTVSGGIKTRYQVRSIKP